MKSNQSLNYISKPNSDFVDLSHNHKTSFDMGQLIPIACVPTMPGDKFKISTDCFVRAMPTIFPIMEDVNIKFNYFYVPNRVVWDKWKDYQTMSSEYKYGGNEKPNVPQIKEAIYNGNRYVNSRLGDYLGYPSVTGGPNDNHVYANNNLAPTYNAIPFLGYQHIYLEWYAPQRWINYLERNGNQHPLINLKGILTKIKNDYAPVLNGSTDAKYPQHIVDEITKLRNVGWNHDYFTNCLPEPQAISDVKIPLVKNLVDGKFFDDVLPNGGDEFNRSPGKLLNDILASNHGFNWASNEAGTINDLRQNIATQHLLEKLNIGGGRYYETIKTIFGVDISDKTLQRPEYLGGDTLQIFFNEVEATTENEQRELGEVAGKPLAGGNTKEVEFFAEEFGYVYVIMHVAPRRSYANAVERHLKLGTIFDALDLPTPEMQGIGDQAVYNWEVDNASWIQDLVNNPDYQEDPNKVFGYAPRFSEWKYSKDRFSGEFKGSLKQWHMSDLIIKQTEINPDFIECKPREDVFNVPGDPDKFFGTFRINLRGTRRLESQVLPGIDYI